MKLNSMFSVFAMVWFLGAVLSLAITGFVLYLLWVLVQWVVAQ